MSNVVRLTPMRRDLEKRLSDLRANGPKHPRALGSPRTAQHVAELRGLLAEILDQRESGVSIKAISPTLDEVIEAGGYKVR